MTAGMVIAFVWTTAAAGGDEGEVNGEWLGLLAPLRLLLQLLLLLLLWRFKS